MADMFDVIGIGFTVLDYACLAATIPHDEKLEAQALSVHGGGPAATATCVASRLGLKTAFAAPVGDDLLGRQIIEDLIYFGVDVHAMVVHEGETSPIAFCWTDGQNGKRSIVWSGGTLTPMKQNELTMSVLDACRLLHLDGHHLEVAICAARKAREQGVLVMLDAGVMFSGIEDLVALSDIVISSEGFASKFTRKGEPEAWVRALWGEHRRFAAVTMGDRGSIGFDGVSIFHQPAFVSDIVDTTGAGDTYHGAFSYGILKGMSWADCMQFASAASALACSELGGRGFLPSRRDVETFLTSWK